MCCVSVSVCTQNATEDKGRHVRIVLESVDNNL